MIANPFSLKCKASDHPHLSNVTFGTSLAFQMKEEHVLEKVYFDKLTSMRVNSGVTQFCTHLCMLVDIFELQIENKQESLGKTVLIMWSQICEKIA